MMLEQREGYRKKLENKKKKPKKKLPTSVFKFMYNLLLFF